MNKILLIGLSVFLATACGNSGQNKEQESEINTETKMETVVMDASTVYVYYFHGKKRCMTCNTVEKVAKKTIEDTYASNSNVKFLLLSIDDKANKALVEKYEISWNGLIVAQGDNSVNITQEAFANAVNSPDVLVELIKNEVDKRLK